MAVLFRPDDSAEAADRPDGRGDNVSVPDQLTGPAGGFVGRGGLAGRGAVAAESADLGVLYRLFLLDSALFTRESQMYEKLGDFSSVSLGRACLFVLCHEPTSRFDFR